MVLSYNSDAECLIVSPTWREPGNERTFPRGETWSHQWPPSKRCIYLWSGKFLREGILKILKKLKPKKRINERKSQVYVWRGVKGSFPLKTDICIIP